MTAEHLTFSQRYGYEPLPTAMRPEEISDDLRRELCNAVRAFFLDGSIDVGIRYFNTETERFAERVLGRFTKRLEREIQTEYGPITQYFERILTNDKFNRVLDLLQIMANEQEGSDRFARQFKILFERHAAAYRMDVSGKSYRFIPCASKEQGDATERAIETIREGNMEGAATHLRQAADHINARQFADSIADSILAVESVARRIDPKASNTLGPALHSLEKSGLLKHPLLKKGFSALYDYTNDEEGVRHSLVFKETADVDLDEAVFMFGACASFAAYLTQKHRRAGGA